MDRQRAEKLKKDRIFNVSMYVLCFLIWLIFHKDYKAIYETIRTIRLEILYCFWF